MGPDWRGPPMPAQLALRVAILGGIGLVAFAIVFLRLWYLEVLSGEKYVAEAQNNQVREFTVQAPRGADPRPPRRGAGRQPHRARAAGEAERAAEQPGAPRAPVRPRQRDRRPAARADPPQDPRGGEGVRGLPRDPAPRRLLQHRLLPAREPAALPRGLGRARLRAPVPAGDARRPRARLHRSGRREGPRRPALRVARARRPDRPAGGRVHLRQPPARDQRLQPAAGRRLGPAHRRAALRARARRPATTSSSRSTTRSSAPARRRSPTAGCPAASWR